MNSCVRLLKGASIEKSLQCIHFLEKKVLIDKKRRGRIECERMFSGSYSRPYCMVSGEIHQQLQSSQGGIFWKIWFYSMWQTDNVTVQRIKVSRVKSKKKKCYCSSSGLKWMFSFFSSFYILFVCKKKKMRIERNKFFAYASI